MEISPFLWTIIWNIVVAIWIILVVLVVKYIKDKLINYIDYITALTVGLLLGIIFLWFIPTIISSGIWAHDAGLFMLIWLFVFYLLELFLHWHHCKDLEHNHSCGSSHQHDHKNWLLMFWWTLMHNAFHGIVLFAAFSVDFHFWVATTFAVLLHSIPQNIVNYIMNHNNIKYAYFAAFGWIIGALVTYPFVDFLVDNKFYILSIITWGLLYTALADIFPEFKWKWTTMKKISYLFFIVIWIIIFLGFEAISEWNHNDNEKHKIVKLNEENKWNKYKCEKYIWKWLENSNECEWINQNICEELKWVYNGCASACRNNTEATICTKQCIKVCKFDK